MSPSGVVSTARARGENRFYVTPAMRKQKQQQQQQQQQQKKEQQSKAVVSNNSALEIEKRTETDQCGYSNCSVSGRVGPDCSTNLDRFLEYTTPVVRSHVLPKTSVKGRQNGTVDHHHHHNHNHRYFVLGDLWESFKEWSAYGAGVPLLLNESETVMQYYVPFLSGIQLYVDPLRSSLKSRRPGEESDAESSRETSSDSSSDCGVERGLSNGSRAWCQQNSVEANSRSLSRLSLTKSRRSSSSEECELPYLTGHLVYQYMEHETPFAREPLADKISALASQFPEIKTYRSCDLSPASWISVAWYPIYRIPMGPTLQNLDACFLTFHSLSTPHHGQNNAGVHFPVAGVRNTHSSKLLLPPFGLASYKLKVAFWNPNGINECQKFESLLQGADNWLKLLKVNHPDYTFFVSRNSSWR